MNAARYIGEEPCPVSLGDRRPKRLEVVSGPPDVVAYLLGRSDFEACEPTADAALEPTITRRRRRPAEE